MTTNGLGGSTPQFNTHGRVPGAKALFFSLREQALIKDKTIKPGYGMLTAGTIMATETGGDLVPYCPVSVDYEDKGRAFLLQDVAAAAVLYMSIDDSWRFAVGDTLIVTDSAGTTTDGGAITAIDRDTYPNMATVTVTNNITATTANKASAHLDAGTAGNHSDATWILDQDVFTGTGEEAKGANASVVISNAILYLSALVGYDATAATSLGMVTDGPHVILK